MKIRTSFAPNPSSGDHIGDMWAAIYNWLYARHEGGQFLPRVEDAVRTVLDAMSWLGLDTDEAPVLQTQRRAAHPEAAELLLSKRLACKEDKAGHGDRHVPACLPWGVILRFIYGRKQHRYRGVPAHEP